MASINGVDTQIINYIKQKTQKQLIIESGKTKIIDEHHDEPREKPNKKNSPSKIKKIVEKLNQKMKGNNTPLYFNIISNYQDTKVQIIETNENVIIREFSADLLSDMVDNVEGLTINKTV